MYILSQTEKMEFLNDVNKLLSQIPNKRIVMPETELTNTELYRNDKGYFWYIPLEHNEFADKFLGKTRNEALAYMALDWCWSFSANYDGKFAPGEGPSSLEQMNEFLNYCQTFIKGANIARIVDDEQVRNAIIPPFARYKYINF